MKDKNKENRVIRRLAYSMGKTADYAVPIVRELLDLPIGEMFTSREEDALRKALAEFKAVENELEQELQKNHKTLSKGIDQYSAKADKLRKQKSKVGARIAEAVTAGAEASDLFLELHKVATELRETEDLLTAIEKQNRYPELDSVKAIGERLFAAGVKVVQAVINFRAVLTMYEKRAKDLILLKNCLLDDAHDLNREFASIEKSIYRSYGHCHPDIASGTWQQLETAAREEIDKRIEGGARR
jgi:chaperonin cofactor prefoldin